jgi:tetratricopeptide (TPR) repeat protein
LGAILELYGERQEALVEYRRAVALDGAYRSARRNLAQCLQRLGRFREALDELRQAEQSGPQQDKAGSRYDELIDEAQRLVELEAQLAEQFPNAALIHPVQAAGIATVLYYQRRYRDALPFYEAAQKDASVFAGRHRYNAACVALKAIHSSPAGLPDSLDVDAPRWRGHALQWLEQEFTSWNAKLQDGTSGGRASARRAFSQWRIDPDLAPVREDAALQRLPPGEARSWNLFWAAVDQSAAELAKAPAPASTNAATAAERSTP